MKYYHGTSYNSGLQILQNGFESGHKIWSCSDSNKIYLVSEKFDNENIIITDFEQKPAVRFATESAQIAAAHVNQKSEDVIVFEFDVNDDVNFSPDMSCINMPDCYEVETNVLNQLICNGVIKMTAYKMKKAYTPYLRVFYLYSLDTNYYRPKNKNLKHIINKLKSINHFYWFYDEFIGVWETIELITKK